MSESKKDLKQHLNSLQENYERYTVLIRETSLASIEQLESDKDLKVRSEIVQLQQDIKALHDKNAKLEAQVADLEVRDTNAKTKISILNHEIQELERLLFHFKKANDPFKNTQGDENLDLHIESYGLRDSVSRKKSSMSFQNLQSLEANVYDSSPTIPLRTYNEFPSPELPVERAPPRIVPLDEYQSIMLPKIALIIDQKEAHDMLNASQLYADHVYVCGDKSKMARVITVERYNIFIFKNRTAVKEERMIPLEKVTQITVSDVCGYVLQIDFQGTQSQESLVLEIYSATSFIDFLCNHQGFDTSRKRCGKIALMAKDDFRNALCNIYDNSNKAGLIEQMDAYNSWSKWSLMFVVRIDNVLSMFAAPECYKYHQYGDYRRNVLLIRMENYNVMQEGQNTGLKKQHMFYIRFSNEKKDVIFSNVTLEKKRTWMKLLSE